jgi:flagellar biosynthesis regulator FlaF
MKQIITKEEVGKAILDLAGQGKKPTLAAVHAALNNRGSMSTLVRLKAEIEAAAQPVTDAPEGLKAFREVWALAVDEGRKQQEAVPMELRESVKALATENERLEGTALAAQNHAAEIEQAKSRAETELSRVKTHVEGDLKQAKTALSEATTQAAGALQKLAETQAAHATQVAALQADLTAAVRKAHELELQLVRAVALLEAKGIQPATAESRKPKHTKETRDPS